MRSSSLRAALIGLLLLAQLLAPFAHTSASASVPPWLAVCTADGPRSVPADDTPADVLHDTDHCVLCRIATTMPGAPHAAALASPVASPTALIAPAPVLAEQGSARYDSPARAPPASG